MVNLEALRSASKALTAGGFRLWMFYASNRPGYTFATGNTIALEYMGMKKDAYNRATRELIEKGYLQQTKGNVYTFHEKSCAGGDPGHHAEDKSPLPQQENTIRNNTPIQIQNSILPVISLKTVEEKGIEGYTIDGDIITFSTGIKYRLIK